MTVYQSSERYFPVAETLSGATSLPSIMRSSRVTTTPSVLIQMSFDVTEAQVFWAGSAVTSSALYVPSSLASAASRRQRSLAAATPLVGAQWSVVRNAMRPWGG